MWPPCFGGGTRTPRLRSNFFPAFVFERPPIHDATYHETYIYIIKYIYFEVFTAEPRFSGGRFIRVFIRAYIRARANTYMYFAIQGRRFVLETSCALRIVIHLARRYARSTRFGCFFRYKTVLEECWWTRRTLFGHFGSASVGKFRSNVKFCTCSPCIFDVTSAVCV